MELAYQKANQEFQIDGRRIVNATAGGNLPIFERVSLMNFLH
jgi:hypothetical protein